MSTISKDGTCHIVPVWFVLDGEDIIFTTGYESVKAKHIMRDNRVSICVNDQKSLYSLLLYIAMRQLLKTIQTSCQVVNNACRAVHG